MKYLYVLLLLMTSICQASGWDIKVVTSGPIVQGYTFQVIYYENDAFEMFTSEGPFDDSLIKITCTPNSLPSNAIIKSIDITFTANASFSGENIKYMEVPYEDTLASNSVMPMFASSFQSSAYYNLVR